GFALHHPAARADEVAGIERFEDERGWLIQFVGMQNQLNLTRAVAQEHERQILTQSLEDTDSTSHAHAAAVERREICLDTGGLMRPGEGGRKATHARVL